MTNGHAEVWDYDRIKAEAKAIRKAGGKCSVGDLIVMDAKNDPFYVGTASDRERAQWFGDVWERYSDGGTLHLRGVHYRISSMERPPVKPDGTPYANTDEDWEWIQSASKNARYLGLVDAAFTDMRTPTPSLFGDGQMWTETPTVTARAAGSWGVEMPSLSYTSEHGSLQPYHLEVWCEKQTMERTLVPLCRKMGANYVPGQGEMSISCVVAAVARIRAADKPARIFYVSDFDPAGNGMPVSVARKLEFFGRGELDIRLDPIVLTAAQVEHYDLPRKPVKAILRTSKFVKTHGDGAVELDALEGIHRGELRKIVSAAMLPYYDQDIEDLVRETEYEAEKEMWAAQEAALAEMQPEIEEIGERLEEARLAAGIRLEAIVDDFDPPPLPVSELEVLEDDDVLFDSGRDYLTQLAHYKDRLRK